MRVIESARIAVVVPAFNEARWIAETVETMPDFVDHVLVVDDASTDATSAAARAARSRSRTRSRSRSRSERVEVIRHARNRGVGAAIITGYRRARALGADVVAVMAGDGQMDPADLRAVLRPILDGAADYVKGNRLLYPGVFRTMPPARLVGTAVLAWLTRHAAGLPSLGDSQCGYTAISASAIDALDRDRDLDAIWPRYGYPNDLLGALSRRSQRVGEVVVRPVYRGEASGLRARHVVTIGYLIGRVAYRRLASHAHPTVTD